MNIIVLVIIGFISHKNNNILYFCSFIFKKSKLLKKNKLADGK